MMKSQLDCWYNSHWYYSRGNQWHNHCIKLKLCTVWEIDDIVRDVDFLISNEEHRHNIFRHLASLRILYWLLSDINLTSWLAIVTYNSITHCYLHRSVWHRYFQGLFVTRHPYSYTVWTVTRAVALSLSEDSCTDEPAERTNRNI